MKIRKLICAIICIMFLISISRVYAFDTQGTYTGTLTQGSNPVEVYVNGTSFGNYTDYYEYDVNLAMNQKIELTLEVPNGADFDLFVYTANESIAWENYSDTLGQDENLVITIPETGNYKFVVADWSGSGSYTLKWTSASAGILGLDLTLIAVIAIIVIVIIIVVIALLMRRRKKMPTQPTVYGTVPPPPAPPMAPSSQPAPAPQTPETVKPASTCPSCGGQLTWIPEYKRWYCYREGKYV